MFSGRIILLQITRPERQIRVAMLGRTLSFGLLILTGACGANSPAEDDTCGPEGCGQAQQAFACQVAVPPQSPRPTASLATAAAAEPAPVGGVIANGTYTTTAVEFFGEFASVSGETIEFRDGFYHRNHTTYLATTGEAMTGFEEVGRFSTDGSTVTLEGTACVAGSPASNTTWEYSATDGGLRILRGSSGLMWEERYELRH